MWGWLGRGHVTRTPQVGIREPGISLVQEYGDIAGSSDDSDDFDRERFGAVDDQILFNRPKEHRV